MFFVFLMGFRRLFVVFLMIILMLIMGFLLVIVVIFMRLLMLIVVVGLTIVMMQPSSFLLLAAMMIAMMSVLMALAITDEGLVHDGGPTDDHLHIRVVGLGRCGLEHIKQAEVSGTFNYTTVLYVMLQPQT